MEPGTPGCCGLDRCGYRAYFLRDQQYHGLPAVSSKNDPGQINVYDVDSESGVATQIATSPFPAGRQPQSLVIDSQGKNLYLVNYIDNTISQYGIGTDAKLYHDEDVNPSGSQPTSLSIHTYTNPTTSVQTNFLFVVETYQPNFTSLNPGPGALFVYQLSSGGAIGSPVTQTVDGQASQFIPLETIPTGANTPTADVNVTPDGNHVYVVDTLDATAPSGDCGVSQGGIEAYNMQFDGNGNATGVLAPVNGTPFCAGVLPTAVTSHPFSTFLYVTDGSQNQVTAYTINTTTNPGALTPLSSSPVATGTTPDGVVVDPRGLYVYVANKFGNSISGYAVNQATGGLSALATGGSGITGAEPGCVIVEPALGRFVYTANLVDGTVSAFVLNPNNGALTAAQGGFYAASGLTSCVAATPHNNHPVITTSNEAYPNGNP